MLFNNLEFFIFFPLVTILYYLLPHRYRWLMLLTASIIFYMAFIPVYVLILILTIAVDYLAAILIEKASGKRKKLYLIISIITTCLILFVFKYYNFFNTNFALIAASLHLNYPFEMMKIILPIGLSFHTFQSLSYVIEVYRGNQKAEKHFGIYSLYVMYYPQLVAGPIERPQNLLYQFHAKHNFNYDNVTNGLKLMAWGLFKKIVIADRLSEFVNQVYNNPGSYEGVPLIVATIFFAFQIYCDFSGYSDIALGASQTMGIKLMQNFNRPYFSKSISEFWGRWHISLSTWFKDYVYIPLGGNRVVKWRWYYNLFITFMISGFWHGANWTYVIWGALHGSYLIMALMFKDINSKISHTLRLNQFPLLSKIIHTGITFMLVCIAWVFFRASSVQDGLYIIEHMVTGLGNITKVLSQERKQLLYLNFNFINFAIATGLITLLYIVHLAQRGQSLRTSLAGKPAFIRWSAYVCLVLSIIFMGNFGSQDFIYFQF